MLWLYSLNCNNQLIFIDTIQFKFKIFEKCLYFGNFKGYPGHFAVIKMLIFCLSTASDISPKFSKSIKLLEKQIVQQI